MKLSEAIREGSKGTRKATGVYVRTRKIIDPITHAQVGKRITSCCALGAVMIASGVSDVEDQGQIRERFPILYLQKVQHYYTDGSTRFISTLAQAIIELNDRHGWTREQIADWIASHGE